MLDRSDVAVGVEPHEHHVLLRDARVAERELRRVARDIIPVVRGELANEARVTEQLCHAVLVVDAGLDRTRELRVHDNALVRAHLRAACQQHRRPNGRHVDRRTLHFKRNLRWDAWTAPGNAALREAARASICGRCRATQAQARANPQLKDRQGPMLAFLFRGLTAQRPDGAALFEALTAEARRPDWYVEGGIPDSLD